MDRGFYGWAVIERHHEENQSLYFIPVAPTNRLKMDPWWNDEAKALADRMRGGMPKATLFRIKDADLKTLRSALRRHLGGGL